MEADPSENPAPVNVVEENADKGESVVHIDKVLQGETPDMPEVQDHAVSAAVSRLEAAESAEKQAEAGEPSATLVPVKGQTDIKGRPFDPAIHESPLRINRDGWIACRRGTPKGGKSAPPASRSFVDTSTPEPQAAPVVACEDEKAKATALLCAGLFVNTGTMILGDEFKPEDAGEFDAVRSSFHEYFKAKGTPDIPPGLALALGLGTYCAKRWNAPKFKEKRESLWMLAKRWWNDFSFRRRESAKMAGGSN